ncbi:hypothetical protein MXB02_09940 [Pseudomonas mosselii]|uniref:hypothetical protein n=1 Tax=Pseudomonas mosselii TaxID=78327 RepID=UPI001FFC17FA|nr:hypothetical protein [Pseudomonas mosselii]UPF05913.1 hypothetical protein MXB02_09940 [Pseudomonas mosselii]
MQSQTPEAGGAKATTPTFQPGDEVTFVISRGTRRSMRFTVRHAKVVQLEGDHAVVQYRNHQCIRVRLTHLTLASGPNALTRALVREASV